MNTLYLDPTTWDLTVDSDGNIAMASNPYSLAQDAASAIMTYSGEVYYDTTQGIPYFSQVLGKIPSLEWLRAKYIEAAESVPEVASAMVYFTGFVDRVLTGQVQITSTSGAVVAVGFN
jgi:hypothetical protein